MKEVYAYIRVSTVKQGEKGSSLAEQRDAISVFATRHNLRIVAWFEEMQTAAKVGRREFTRMLRLLERGSASGVILHKIDRGARNLKDWANLRDMTERGIDIYFAHESLDLTTRSGALAADLQAVIAADYIRNLRDEVRKGIGGRLKQGLYPFQAPLGYLDRGGGMPKIPDPRTAPFVRRAFELYASGTHTYETLAHALHELGLRNIIGGPLSKNGVATLLNNPFYVGLMLVRSQVFEGVHEPIITKALFDRVKAVIEGRTQVRSAVHDFLFRKLITCAACSHLASGEAHKGYIYYRCHSPSCRVTSATEEIVDLAVRKALRPIQLSREELDELHGLHADLKANWTAQRDAQLQSLNLLLSQTDDRLKRLTDAYIDRAIDREAFETRKQTLLMDRKSFRERIETVRETAHTIPDRVFEFFELAQSALLSYESGNRERKRELVQTTTSNLKLILKEVVVELRNPFSQVANRHLVTCGGPNRDDLRTLSRSMKALIESIVTHVSTEN